MSIFFTLFSTVQAASFAVLPLDSDARSTANLIENQIRGAVVGESSNRLLTGKDLQSQLKLIEEDHPCYQLSCAKEIGDKLGVDFVVYGQYRNDWLRLEILDVNKEKRVLNRSYNLERQNYERIYVETKAILQKQNPEVIDTFYANRYFQKIGYRSDYIFDAVPKDVSVYVDGHKVCDSMPCSVSLEAGTHSALFEKPGYKSENWVFHTSQKFMPRLEGVPTTMEMVDVDASVDIWLDGNKLNRNALDAFEVSPGEHTLTYVSSCYQNQTDAISVAVRQNKKVKPDLKPLMQIIFIPKEDKREQVFVDGEFVGYTGDKIHVPRCAQSLHFGGLYHPIEFFKLPSLQ